MFGKSKQKTPPSKPLVALDRSAIPSVISADINLLGNIIGAGVIDLDGRIEGNVRCYSLSIRPNGKVRGDVLADNVQVHGTVEGTIKARVVTLYPTARVTGTIMHESLTIEDGAFVDGKFKRTDKIVFDDMPALSYSPPIESMFENDNDDDDGEPSEEELKVLENLRLIS
jgi:cytoskeletal protein CcmA (bactofilin family)